MPPYDSQMFTRVYAQVFSEFIAHLKERAHTSSRSFSWQQISRQSARKLGILLMRVGWKLVDWGTSFHAPPQANEA